MDKIKRWKLLEGSTGVHDNNGSFVEFTDHQSALDAVLQEAIWAMEEVVGAYAWTTNFSSSAKAKLELQRAQAFLARPDVQAWRARQKEQG